jgi:hypothetical protein
MGVHHDDPDVRRLERASETVALDPSRVAPPVRVLERELESLVDASTPQPNRPVM